jgi:hypothetical protein
MPTATDKLREQMTRWFGGIDCYEPLAFLRSHGFTEKGGHIRPPVPSHNVSRDEGICIDFLFQEWDFAYGGCESHEED